MTRAELFAEVVAEQARLARAGGGRDQARSPVERALYAIHLISGWTRAPIVNRKRPRGPLITAIAQLVILLEDDHGR